MARDSVSTAQNVLTMVLTVTVDGNQVAQLSGDEPQNEEQYQQALYSTNILKQEGHAVSLSNAGGGYVDIDFVTTQSQVGNSTQNIQTATVQDTDPRFSYQGQDWNEIPANVSMVNNGTGHSSTTEGASVVLSFTGEAVSLFGSVGPQNGFYSAQLDSEPASTYNATRQILLTQVMLYHADNLGSGGHQLTLTNAPQVAGQSLNIDYAEIMTLSNSIQNPELGASISQSISHGVIAALVVLGVTTLILGLSNLYLYRRLRTSEAGQVDMYRAYAGRPMTQYETAASQAFTSVGNTDHSDDPSSHPAPSSQFGISNVEPFVGESLNNDAALSPGEALFADPRQRNSGVPTVSSSLPDYAQAIGRRGRR